MINKFLNIILFLQVSLTFSQENVLSPKEATRIINSGEYEINESIEHDLDTIGSKIIQQLFYDKANYPDRISKEEYLKRYRSPKKEYLGGDGFSKFETKIILQTHKSRSDNKEYRKRVYTLENEDSLLIYGNDEKINNQKIKGIQPLWRLCLFDTTITANPYYSFFGFKIQLVDGNHNYDIWPRTVANSVTEKGEYTGRASVFIYDSKFLVGIPKVSLKNQKNEEVELPLLLLGKDFVTYSSNQILLESILKVSGYSDSASIASLVLLHARFEYGASKQLFNKTTCRKINLFNKKKCYKFSTLERKYQIDGFKYISTEYIATINKSYDIKYKLVEEPQNLMPYIEENCNRFYDLKYKETPNIDFIAKRGRKFIYKTDWIVKRGWTYKNGKEQFEDRRFKAKITYKRGEVYFKEIKFPFKN